MSLRLCMLSGTTAGLSCLCSHPIPSWKPHHGVPGVPSPVFCDSRHDSRHLPGGTAALIQLSMKTFMQSPDCMQHIFCIPQPAILGDF